MTTVKLQMNDNSELQLSHRELCWFVRELIEWRAIHLDDDRGYKAALSRVESRLKYDLRVEFTPIADARRENLFAKGFSTLHDPEIDFLQKALRHAWLSGVSSEQLQILGEVAKKRAKSPRALIPLGRGHTTAAWAEVLGLSTQIGSQQALQKFKGKYFIFRRIFSVSKLVVSYMEILQDDEARFPAEFVTTGLSAGAMYEIEDRVEGIMYQPPEESNVIFSIGKYVGSTQIRSAIFEPTRKPVDDAQNLPRDLMGVRLGLSRPRRDPRGYRIWCSRLTEPSPDLGWEHFAREYSLAEAPSLALSESLEFNRRHGLQPHQFFSQRIHGFNYILNWLSNPKYATLRANGDPTI